MGNRSHITRFGLPGIDRVPFGVHACHFYRNREELISAVVPYFLAGLHANERCLWVTAPPLPAHEAFEALRPHGVEEAIQTSRLQVLDFDQWYANQAGLNGHDILELWLKEEEHALADGYNGIRIAGNTSFLQPDDWSAFIKYEQAVTVHFKNRRIVALCSYPLAQCNAQQMSEVVDSHHWVLQGSDADCKWAARFPTQFKSRLTDSPTAD